MVKHTWHKNFHLNHFYTYSPIGLKILTLLCKQSPKLLSSCKIKIYISLKKQSLPPPVPGNLYPVFSLYGFYFSRNLICCYCYLVAKSCLTLCDPMDFSLPGSSGHGISKARKPEWVAMLSSRGSSRPTDWIWVSCTGRWVLYHWTTREAQKPHIVSGLFHSG